MSHSKDKRRRPQPPKREATTWPKTSFGAQPELRQKLEILLEDDGGKMGEYLRCLIRQAWSERQRWTLYMASIQKKAP